MRLLGVALALASAATVVFAQGAEQQFIVQVVDEETAEAVAAASVTLISTTEAVTRQSDANGAAVFSARKGCGYSVEVGGADGKAARKLANVCVDRLRLIVPLQRVRSVSLVALLADWERYRGRTIEVEGLLSLGFEKSYLYLNREDAVNHIVNNSVGVQLEPEERIRYAAFDGAYVSLSGTVDCSPQGSPGCEAVLRDVHRVIRLGKGLQ